MAERSVDVPGVNAWVGSANISPTTPLPLAGYTRRSGPFVAIADRLEANFIALETGADEILTILSIDCLFSSTKLEKEIASQANVSEVWSVASHTHYAPPLESGKPLLGPATPEHITQVSTDISAAVRDALSLPPVRVDWCSTATAACDLSISRRLPVRLPRREIAFAPNPNEVVDHTVDTLQVLSAGRPVAVIWTWACHATNYWQRNHVSADYIGAVRERVRETFGNHLPVLFFPGFAGDLRTNFTPRLWQARRWLGIPWRGRFARATRENYQFLCDSLSGSVLESLGGPIAKQEILGVNASTVSQPLSCLFEGPVHADAREFLVRKLEFGPIKMLLASAEVCSPYRSLVREVAPEYTFLSGYTGDVFGYLPTARQVAEGGYESTGFMQPFSIQGTLSRECESQFIKMVEQVTG